MKKAFLLIISLFITTTFVGAENNQLTSDKSLYLDYNHSQSNVDNNEFGFYGYLDEMPYAVGQCFNNIVKVNGNSDDYNIKISYGRVSAIGKTTIFKDRCGVFVFNDAIVGAMQGYNGNNNQFKWFIEPDGVHIYGESGSYTGAMQYALSKLKHKKVFYLHLVDGSFDDEVNLYATMAIRRQGYNTVLPNGGKIYSGGVDFFLSGNKRAIENKNFKFGVHSWANNERQGKDYPKNHPEHTMFLEAMQEMGIDEEFYWYTLNVAPAGEIHHMTLDEINKFNLINSTYVEAIK